jgi:hypothetical protein
MFCFVAIAITAWTAYPHCPTHLRKEVEARARSFSSAFLKEPVDKEVFNNIEHYRERL